MWNVAEQNLFVFEVHKSHFVWCFHFTQKYTNTHKSTWAHENTRRLYTRTVSGIRENFWQIKVGMNRMPMTGVHCAILATVCIVVNDDAKHVKMALYRSHLTADLAIRHVATLLLSTLIQLSYFFSTMFCAQFFFSFFLVYYELEMSITQTESRSNKRPCYMIQF